jgi:hypothetical protein
MSYYTKYKCPLCYAVPVFNHRDGVGVCKCETKGCPGNERWLTYDEWADFQSEHKGD